MLGAQGGRLAAGQRGDFWPTGHSPICLPSQKLALNAGQWCCLAGREALDDIPDITQTLVAHCKRGGRKSPRSFAALTSRPPDMY